MIPFSSLIPKKDKKEKFEQIPLHIELIPPQENTKKEENKEEERVVIIQIL